MKKGRSTWIFLIIAIVVGIFSYASIAGVTMFDYLRFRPVDESIGKGLDLVGGISVVEKVVDYNISDEDLKAVMDGDGVSKAKALAYLQNEGMKRTVSLIEKRVNRLGISETVVAREGDDRIRIEIPGVYDSEEIINLVGKSGILKFVGPDGEVILTGKDVENAVGGEKDFKRFEVSLDLNAEGTQKFEAATKKYMDQVIEIYLDEELIVAPMVGVVITDGKAVITNVESKERAKNIANLIKSGALPIALKVETYKTVGATLGENAVPMSAMAGLIGVAMIILFMIAYYRVPGIIAGIGLILFINLNMNIFALLGGVLTLAGIAGLLLTIGMAVDANVLIFERIKEEIKGGKSPRVAVESGYKRAFWSIFDANITTLIAALILYFIGSGAVKGFALTLIIGIGVSMFTALIFTKYLLKLGMSMGILKNPGHFGVKRG